MNPRSLISSVRFWLSLTVLAAAAIVGVWVSLSRQSVNDTGRSPKPASQPAVNDRGFVGSEACVRCHSDEAAKHAGSGHAHTFHDAHSFELTRGLAGKSFHDEERNAEFRYELADGGLSVALPERFGNDVFPLTYAFGSGRHAVTLLSLIPNRAGETVGIEHRVSLFRDGKQLGLTPNHRGRAATQTVEHFGKVVKGEILASCIGCHTTSADIQDHTLKRLIPQVGCESCHGPGAKHIAAVEARQSDLEIEFSPSRHGALEQIRMCGRCHRLPEMHSETPRKQDAKLARFQPIGLMQSRCFQRSNGQLSCTTCHDPHASVSHNASDYERRCVSCHSPQVKSQKPCRVSPLERCIDCHMPPVEVHSTISFHDHWIRVRDANDPTAVSDSDHSGDHAEPISSRRKN